MTSRSMNRGGFAYLTSTNQLFRIDLSTGEYEPISDGLLGPTTSRWVERKEPRKSLYVGTTGGAQQWLSGNATVNGAIHRVVV
jgi:hypothetical protein